MKIGALFSITQCIIQYNLMHYSTQLNALFYKTKNLDKLSQID